MLKSTTTSMTIHIRFDLGSLKVMAIAKIKEDLGLDASKGEFSFAYETDEDGDPFVVGVEVVLSPSTIKQEARAGNL